MPAGSEEDYKRPVSPSAKAVLLVHAPGFPGGRVELIDIVRRLFLSRHPKWLR
jgi:hypothetical protein